MESNIAPSAGNEPSPLCKQFFNALREHLAGGVSIPHQLSKRCAFISIKSRNIDMLVEDNVDSLKITADNCFKLHEGIITPLDDIYNRIIALLDF